MQVIKIDPGCKPELTELPNTLRAYQQAVGGHIEAHTITRNDLPALVVILNEEGRLRGLPANGRLYMGHLWGQTLMGPVVIVRADESGEDFAGATDGDLQLVAALWNPVKRGGRR